MVIVWQASTPGGTPEKTNELLKNYVRTRNAPLQSCSAVSKPEHTQSGLINDEQKAYRAVDRAAMFADLAALLTYSTLNR